MLTRPVGGGGGGVCYWSKTGNDIYYTAGKVSIGTSTPTYDFEVSGKFSQYYMQKTAYSGTDPNGLLRAWRDYHGVQHPSGAYGYLGATLEVVTRHTANGATKPIGTSNGFASQSWIQSNGSVYSEATPLWVGLTSDDRGRLWGTDRNVNGPIANQCDLLMGDSLVVNNYNAGAIANGGWGAVLTTQPGAGGMVGFTGRTGLQTYPLTSMLAIVGWSGTGNKSVETVAATKAIQIGGFAGGWMGYGVTSKFDYGIDVTDWVTNGILVSGRKPGATGADIKCTGVLQIGDYASVTPAGGMMKYDVSLGFLGYHNSAWSSLGGGGGGDIDGGSFSEVYTYTANVDGGGFV